MGKKKKRINTSPLIWYTELVEISDAVDVYDLVFMVMWFGAYAQKEHSCGSSLWWSTWKTGLTWKAVELYTFCGHVICRGHLSNGVILLCDKAWLHKAQQTWNLLQNFIWEMLDCPSHSLELASSSFQLFFTLKEYLFTYDELLNVLSSYVWHNFLCI